MGDTFTIKLYSEGSMFKLELTEQCIRMEKPTNGPDWIPRFIGETLLVRHGKTAILKSSHTYFPTPSLNLLLRADSFV